VTLVAVDSRLAGFEPTFRTGVAPGRRLTRVAAVDLLAALRECCTATATLSHAPTLRSATDNKPPELSSV